VLSRRADLLELDVLPAIQPTVSKYYRKTQWFGRLLCYSTPYQHPMSNQQQEGSLFFICSEKSCGKQEGWQSPTEHASVSAINLRHNLATVPQESLRNILASHGYDPGTIAVNATWMKRGFNACQTHRSMYPYIFNRLWAIARYWSEIATFFYPLAFNAPVRVFPLEFLEKVWFS